VAREAKANERGERKDKVCCYYDIQLRGEKQSLEVPAAAEVAYTSGCVRRMWKIEVRYKHGFVKWIFNEACVLKYLDLKYFYSVFICKYNSTKAV
jgi:hypothetical protein